jgi:hypothetical protein
MHDVRETVSLVFIELFTWIGGGVCLRYGIKKGFVEKLMFRRGERIQGSAAVMWGLFYVALGLLGWATGALWLWLSLTGRG